MRPGELLRPPGAPWTVADVPLLDEAAELLGSDLTGDPERDRADAAERRDERTYAEDVLIYHDDFEILDEAGPRLGDLLDAEHAGRTAPRPRSEHSPPPSGPPPTAHGPTAT